MNVTYNGLKLELADIIRGVLHLARLRQHDENAARAQGLLARLAEDRFQLAVVGRFNAGKSSLMNAVMGQPILPTGVRPLTSAVTSVAYGSTPEVEIRFRNGGLPAHGPVADLAKYVTEDSNPANRMEVQSAFVRAPIEALRRGFYFIDTPGVGSDILANTAATERFLPDADAVIFVTSFETSMQADEVEFLHRAREHARKIFLVVNKADLLTDESRSAALNVIRQRIQSALQTTDSVRVFAVSARDGLIAKQNHEGEALDASGFPELEGALWDFLAREKQRVFLAGVVDRSSALIAAERFYATLGRGSGDQKEQTSQNIAARADEMCRAAAGLKETVKAKIYSELPVLLEPELRRWSQEMIEVEAAEPTPAADTLKSAWEAWMRRQGSTLPSSVLKIAGPEIRKILGSSDELKREVAEMFAIEAPPLVSGESADFLERMHPVFHVPPQKAGIQLPWWADVLPRGWRNRIRRRAIVDAVREYAHACRTRTVEAAVDWGDRLFRGAAQRQERELASVLKALQAETADADYEKLADLAAALKRFQECAGEWEEYRPAGMVDGSLHSVRCVVCADLAETVYKFLSHDQYALATDPHRQAALVEDGGFCTLHAWQYESIAAPQGLCVAYAPVLEVLARLLRAAAVVEQGNHSLNDGVASAWPAERKCRLCALVAERERASSIALAARLTSSNRSEYPHLCILHLRSVVEAGVAPHVVAGLLEAEAAILERCATDMRMYSLKHESVRRELMTEEERTAWRRGLAWVAGEPAMARPWRTR